MYSYIFFNPGTSKLYKKIPQTHFVFYWTEDTTRTRTLNRIPIWHGLIMHWKFHLSQIQIAPCFIHTFIQNKGWINHQNCFTFIKHGWCKSKLHITLTIAWQNSFLLICIRLQYSSHRDPWIQRFKIKFNSFPPIITRLNAPILVRSRAFWDALGKLVVAK